VHEVPNVITDPSLQLGHGPLLINGDVQFGQLSITFVASESATLVPIPSCPYPLYPKEKTDSFDKIQSECSPPAVMDDVDITPTPRDMTIGTSELTVFPFPS